MVESVCLSKNAGDFNPSERLWLWYAITSDLPKTRSEYKHGTTVFNADQTMISRSTSSTVWKRVWSHPQPPFSILAWHCPSQCRTNCALVRPRKDTFSASLWELCQSCYPQPEATSWSFQMDWMILGASFTVETSMFPIYTHTYTYMYIYIYYKL